MGQEMKQLSCVDNRQATRIFVDGCNRRLIKVTTDFLGSYYKVPTLF